MMTKIVELEVVQATLSELIAGLGPDEEVVIVQNDKTVAKLVPPPLIRQPRRAGNCKGMITITAEDDEHLQDFKDYMP